MERVKLFLRDYIRGIDLNQDYYVNTIIKPYQTLKDALETCGHETTELTNAIEDCRLAMKKLLEVGLKARQQFEKQGFQNVLLEHISDKEKDTLV